MKVRLLKQHTHGGKDYQAGADIDVTHHQAQWLAEQGVIAAPAPAATETASAETAPAKSIK